ncbi:putative six-bladed beta-propeller, TolB [Helianthus annuus]|nr:putative six-bladed beta-propeller, TolB [Helianthus annuus]
MASSSSNFLTIIVIASFILLVNLTQVIAGESIVLEEGYTVTTVIDGNKLNVNLYAVIPLFGSSSDLVILDNVKSTFYTVSLSDSQVGELKKLAGNANGVAGYKDGDLGSAEFKKPKNFAVDKKNNIYVADTSNHVIRKISKSGVTTIAGGNTRKTGKTDGPAQNASFSDLKAEDCADTSSGSVLGSTIAWSIGVVVTCLVGFVFGFAVRPYVRPYEASGQHPVNVTWKHFLTSLEKQAVTFYFVTRNAIASRNVYQLLKNFLMLSFSQLLLLFGINIIKPPTMQPKPVSLLDCDALVSNEITKPRDLVDELTDMITFDGTQNPKLCLDQNNACYMVEENKEVVVENGGKIDKHIHANLVGFVESSKGTSSVGSSSL